MRDSANEASIEIDMEKLANLDRKEDVEAYDLAMAYENAKLQEKNKNNKGEIIMNNNQQQNNQVQQNNQGQQQNNGVPTSGEFMDSVKVIGKYAIAALGGACAMKFFSSDGSSSREVEEFMSAIDDIM